MKKFSTGSRYEGMAVTALAFLVVLVFSTLYHTVLNWHVVV